MTIYSQLKNCYTLKPKEFETDELTWKLLFQAVLRGKNIMLTGYQGCGKSMAAFAIAEATGRNIEVFNIGASQDPRSMLIGNLHLDVKTGTSFSNSRFVKAIQKPNNIILLDELSRGNKEAWNILMTVLDRRQRYLALDESRTEDIVKVADGVSFIATANIGRQFTSARKLDIALTDRFTWIEIPALSKEDEFKLMRRKFKKLEPVIINALTEISGSTRDEMKKPMGSNRVELDNIISTRLVEEAAEMMLDGLSLYEAAQGAFYCHFDDDERLDAPRKFVIKAVQRHDDLVHQPIDDDSALPFDTNDVLTGN